MCCCFISSDDEYILACIGLVKHPQVMSCVYITLFLVTVLIIAQQVITRFVSFTSFYFILQSFCSHINACPPQNESCFRQDFLLKYKNRTEQDEIETRENLNRLLLENVLPAHVAALFVGENKKNEVSPHTSVFL